jgi:hypothetical protein
MMLITGRIAPPGSSRGVVAAVSRACVMLLSPVSVRSPGPIVEAWQKRANL